MTGTGAEGRRGRGGPAGEKRGCEERHLEVPRTARYALLGRPGEAVEEVWLVLHGYRQLARRFLRRFRSLDDGTRFLVAPEGLSRFYLDDDGGRHGLQHRVGASWMTREDREAEIHDYVRYLDRLVERTFEEVDTSEVRLRVLGFSQGCHTAARWTVLGGAPPDQLVLWGAYLPPDLDPEAAARRLGELDLLLVRGDDDGHADHERARGEAARLEAWGVSYRTLRYSGGHEITEEVLERVARTRS